MTPGSLCLLCICVLFERENRLVNMSIRRQGVTQRAQYNCRIKSNIYAKLLQI